MEFTIEKIEHEYIVKEQGNIIFTCDYEFEEKLLSLYLRNIYGDEALSVYQIKKWYTPLKPDRAFDFTIYEQDTKMGELHKIKGGYSFQYQGVTYRFFGGLHASKKTVICFDRDEQVAEIVYDDVTSLRFSNSSLGAVMAILCALSIECDLFSGFSQEMFTQRYSGNFSS